MDVLVVWWDEALILVSASTFLCDVSMVFQGYDLSSEPLVAFTSNQFDYARSRESTDQKLGAGF